MAFVPLRRRLAPVALAAMAWSVAPAGAAASVACPAFEVERSAPPSIPTNPEASSGRRRLDRQRAQWSERVLQVRMSSVTTKPIETDSLKVGDLIYFDARDARAIALLDGEGRDIGRDHSIRQHWIADGKLAISATVVAVSPWAVTIAERGRGGGVAVDYEELPKKETSLWLLARLARAFARAEEPQVLTLADPRAREAVGGTAGGRPRGYLDADPSENSGDFHVILEARHPETGAEIELGILNGSWEGRVLSIDWSNVPESLRANGLLELAASILIEGNPTLGAWSPRLGRIDAVKARLWYANLRAFEVALLREFAPDLRRGSADFDGGDFEARFAPFVRRARFSTGFDVLARAAARTPASRMLALFGFPHVTRVSWRRDRDFVDVAWSREPAPWWRRWFNQ